MSDYLKQRKPDNNDFFNNHTHRLHIQTYFPSVINIKPPYVVFKKFLTRLEQELKKNMISPLPEIESPPEFHTHAYKDKTKNC